MTQATAVPDSHLDARIGKYELLGHIAAGGMADVFRARDAESGRVVALKVLTGDLARTPTLLKRFEREARAAARLHHPNIVAVLDAGEANGVHYIAMEYVEGIDLLRYVQEKGALSPRRVLAILRQAAQALHHAHEHGIVHRDVKPSNLLLARQGQRRVVKLGDFGLALDRADERDTPLTRDNTAVGTVDYMAPEQARGGRTVDIRGDIYSLGCTAYHLLTGRPPFADGTVIEKLYKHVHVMPADPRDFNPAVSDELITVLAKMLAKAPEDRQQTPAELLKELEQGRASLTSQADEPVPPVPPTEDDDPLVFFVEEEEPAETAATDLPPPPPVSRRAYAPTLASPAPAPTLASPAPTPTSTSDGNLYSTLSASLRQHALELALALGIVLVTVAVLVFLAKTYW